MAWNSLGSGHILPYIPPLVLIRIECVCVLVMKWMCLFCMSVMKWAFHSVCLSPNNEMNVFSQSFWVLVMKWNGQIIVSVAVSKYLLLVRLLMWQDRYQFPYSWRQFINAFINWNECIAMNENIHMNIFFFTNPHIPISILLSVVPAAQHSWRPPV